MLNKDALVEDLALAIANKANMHETRLGIVGPDAARCDSNIMLFDAGIRSASFVTVVQEERVWQACDTESDAEQFLELRDIWDRLWCILKLGSPWLAPSAPAPGDGKHWDEEQAKHHCEVHGYGGFVLMQVDYEDSHREDLFGGLSVQFLAPWIEQLRALTRKQAPQTWPMLRNCELYMRV